MIPDRPVAVPSRLANKIRAARLGLEGERKQVTVLFADVRGSMELAEAMDPEAWHTIIERLFGLLSEGVHRFDGTVTQFTGDGMMAIFGAPIALEDHARRACYAALHLQDALVRQAREWKRTQGITCSVRMGLNSGEVVVGSVGDDLRMDYTAVGHTVGLGQRMEQLADPGTTYLTGHTAHLVEGFVTLEDLGLFDVKGVRQPVDVYRLVGVGPVRTRLELSRRRGFSRFVGRGPEMGALEAPLSRAIEGHGQVVGVVAEPGMGKSRLCHEFLEGCRGRGISVREAHAVAHGKAVPFLPILELFRDLFGISERDSDQLARNKIAGALVLLDPSFHEALPLLFDFLGVPDPEHPAPELSPQARKRHLLSLVRQIVAARSRREPAILFFEDLHWMDSASESVLAALVDAASESRTLVLVTFRPGYHAPWMEKSSYQQLPIHSLGGHAVDELLEHLVGSDPSVLDLCALVADRTAGNPFFIEEVVQSLADAGVLDGSKGAYLLARPIAEVAIPETVEATLAARIDRLGARNKAVLQAGAVVGKEFSQAMVARVAGLDEAELDDSLQALVAAELLYEESFYPERDYRFKHPLTQEVAYRSQLAEDRSRMHALVAQAIIDLTPDRLDERAALIAHHWEQADNPMDAARWARRAADWVGTNDLPQAVGYWRAVRTLLARLPETSETIDIGLAACTQLLFAGYRGQRTKEEEKALYSAGRVLAAKRGDAEASARLLYAMASAKWAEGEVSEALELITEAAPLADLTEILELKVAVRQVSGSLSYLIGRVRASLEFIDEALSLMSSDPGMRSSLTLQGSRPYILASSFRAEWPLAMLGRLDESLASINQAFDQWAEGAEPELLATLHWYATQIAFWRGDADSARTHARACIEITERAHLPGLFRAISRHLLGLAHLLDDDSEKAIASFREHLRLAEETGAVQYRQAEVLALLAAAYLGAGLHAEAHTAAERALVVARRQGTRLYECDAHLAMARVMLTAEGTYSEETMRATLEQALALAKETEAKTYEPFVRVELAELARVTGDNAGYERELGEAHRLFIEIGASLRAHALTSGNPLPPRTVRASAAPKTMGS